MFRVVNKTGFFQRAIFTQSSGFYSPVMHVFSMSCLTPRSILPVLFCVLLCFLLAAGCTGTSPPSPAGQKTPAATGTIPAGATSLMLTGVPDVRQA
ncbi:MAG: hypothetical protein NTV84_03560, partial [Methanoregula sp.]|nr:hypothetical protein [Methanoregula sp.]